MHTDILIGLLSRIVPLRLTMAEQCKVCETAHEGDHSRAQADPSKPKVCPLKLVIMSATLRVDGLASICVSSSSY